ncbi:MAG TPA: DUF2723 domain-containing protein [Chloroflexota bacterium]
MTEQPARRRKWPRSTSGAALLGVVVLLVYWPTVSPTVTLRNGGGDGGDLVRAAWTLGVPHPTGYPLWVILAHISTWLPSGEPAHRVALLSTLAAACAVALVTLASSELLSQADSTEVGLPSLLGPAAGGAVLAFSLLFWQQATIPETYALDSLLVALGLWLLLRWLNGNGQLWWATAAVALALANHLVSLSLLAALLVALLVRLPRPDRAALWRALVPFFVTPLFYLFLLFRARAHPLANWGDPQTIGALVTQVTAAEYHHFLTSRSPAGFLLDLARWPGRLREQFSVVGALLAVWSLLLVLVRVPRAGAVLITALLVDLIIVAQDGAPAAPAYLHVSYLVLAIALGAGVVLLPSTLANSGRSRTVALWLASGGTGVLALFLAFHTQPVVNLHGDYSLEQQAKADLSAVPNGGVLLTQGDNPLFALWYVQDVLGVRPDIVVWSLNLVLDPWYGPEMHRRYPTVIPATLPATETAAADQVIVTNLRARDVDSILADPLLTNRYQLQPNGPIYRVVGPR